MRVAKNAFFFIIIFYFLKTVTNSASGTAFRGSRKSAREKMFLKALSVVLNAILLCESAFGGFNCVWGGPSICRALLSKCGKGFQTARKDV